MILPSMNDAEKGYEAFRVTEWLCGCFEEYKRDIIQKFRKGTRYPYFQRVRCRDDKCNEWWLTCLQHSKEYRKNMKFTVFAYTIYDVPPKRSEFPTNAGKGVIVFDPISMKRFLDYDKREAGSLITDITPHAINRYTERFLIPNGKEGLEIQRKVESIMLRWMHFDIAADLYGDKNAAKHKDDGICPVDIIMRGGGMFRGCLVDNIFLRLSTYVSDDMMFDNQKDRWNEMKEEYLEWKRQGLKV